MRPRYLIALAPIAFAIASLSLLPPVPQSLAVPAGNVKPVRGAIHIHTRRSDGTGTMDQVADAAARAGLSFVIVTDHGDGTREPDRPVYRNSVLCIDALEISTNGGHVVALGMSRSPYPLGGEPRDVVEDIARLGGMSIAAHPTSSKEALRWGDWSAPIDGLEWLNGDSEWRDERYASLARALLTYPLRRTATLARLLDRPVESLRMWDALTATKPLVAVAASDAHARIGLRDEGDPFQPRIALHVPAYEQVFRSFSIALSGVSLTQDASLDAKAVLGAIRHGHLFSSIDALAEPAIVSYAAESGGVYAQAGDTIRAGRLTTFRVESNAPAGATITLLRDGREVAKASGPRLEHASKDAGVYRVEIELQDAPGKPPIPWVVTNPIYVRDKFEEQSRTSPSGVFTARYQDGPADGWRVEKSANSEGAFNVVPTVSGTQLSFRFALGGTEGESPFSGLVMTAGSIAGSDRIAFTAAASRPMRVSVQLRASEGSRGERWRRSVYLDETARPVTVRFDEMIPIGSAEHAHPVVDSVRDVLFVVDTINARPGSNGQIWIDDVKYGH